MERQETIVRRLDAIDDWAMRTFGYTSPCKRVRYRNALVKEDSRRKFDSLFHATPSRQLVTA